MPEVRKVFTKFESFGHRKRIKIGWELLKTLGWVGEVDHKTMMLVSVDDSTGTFLIQPVDFGTLSNAVLNLDRDKKRAYVQTTKKAATELPDSDVTVKLVIYNGNALRIYPLAEKPVFESE